MEISNQHGLWRVNEGDLVLINSAYSGKGNSFQRIMGRFSDTEERPVTRSRPGGAKRNYLILSSPYWNLSLTRISGVNFPTITTAKQDLTRAIDFIEDIRVGPEEIAQFLPQIDKAYEAYVPFIKELARTIRG